MRNLKLTVTVGALALPIVALTALATESDAPMAMKTIVAPGAKAVFSMGSNDDDLKHQPSFDHADYFTDDEKPRHTVMLTVPFSMGQFEVTNQQFCDVMNRALADGSAVVDNGDLVTPDGVRLLGIAHVCDDSPYLCLQLGIELSGGRLRVKPGMGDHPAHGVSWFGAVVFCNFLSKREGFDPVYDLRAWKWDRSKNGYRLPTEAEWEYAARKDTRHTFAWGDAIGVERANYAPSISVRPKHMATMPVGFFDGTVRNGLATRDNASPFGIHDMTGNLWEWCWDWYGRAYYQSSPSTDPIGPEKGDDRPPYAVKRPTRVWRGGGFAAPDAWARIGKRYSATPETTIGETGFRVARSLLDNGMVDTGK